MRCNSRQQLQTELLLLFKTHTFSGRSAMSKGLSLMFWRRFLYITNIAVTTCNTGCSILSLYLCTGVRFSSLLLFLLQLLLLLFLLLCLLCQFYQSKKLNCNDIPKNTHTSVYPAIFLQHFYIKFRFKTQYTYSNQCP